VEALEEKLSELCAERERLRAVSARALETFETRFEISGIARRYLEVYLADGVARGRA
jgi:glycosyltransferase involved in cell wall biosynthesis